MDNTKQLTREFRVRELPTEDLQRGDKYYLLIDDEYFTTFIVGEDLKLYPLVVQFVAQSASEIFDSAPQSDTDIFD